MGEGAEATDWVDDFFEPRVQRGIWTISCNLLLTWEHPLEKLGPFDTREQAEQALQDWKREREAIRAGGRKRGQCQEKPT